MDLPTRPSDGMPSEHVQEGSPQEAWAGLGCQGPLRMVPWGLAVEGVLPLPFRLGLVFL